MSDQRILIDQGIATASGSASEKRAAATHSLLSGSGPGVARHGAAFADGAEEPRQAGLPQLALLLGGSCMSVLGAVLIAPVLPQMTDAFAGTAGVATLVPIVLTVPALLIGLTSPFAGIIADKLDRKRLLLIAMVAYAIFGTAPLYLPSLTAIVISRVLVGVCEAAIMTCCTTLIGDYWEGARRSRYLGLQTLVAAFAATIFLVVGGLLGAHGWRTPFWMYVIALLLVIPMAKLLWQPARSASHTRGQRLEPVPWRRLLVPCLITLFGGVLFYALIVELSFVLSGVGVKSSASIGAISAVMSLATALGSVVFGRVTRLSPKALVPISFGLAAVGLVVLFATTSVPVITVGAALTGFGTGLLLPTLLTWTVNRLTFLQRGRGVGLWTGLLFIGEFISPIVINGITGGVGGLQPALAVVGVAAAVMAVITFFGLRGNAERLDSTLL